MNLFVPHVKQTGTHWILVGLNIATNIVQHLVIYQPNAMEP
tara:strand:+ start:2801 stop:2923 length:123 start_codon:yes stop_codon:yes gene_type:complete